MDGLVFRRRRKNNPTFEHHHPLYHPLGILPNSALDKCDKFDSTEDKWFMDPQKDTSYEVERRGIKE